MIDKETGIAHTLGKTVISITQNLTDIQHHRALKYLSNDEGLKNLEDGLKKRLESLVDKLKFGAMFDV